MEKLEVMMMEIMDTIERIYLLLSCWFALWLIMNVSQYINHEFNKFKSNLKVRGDRNG